MVQQISAQLDTWHATQKVTRGTILEDYEIRSSNQKIIKKKKKDILLLRSFLKKWETNLQLNNNNNNNKYIYIYIY